MLKLKNLLKNETVNNTPKTFRGKRVLASRLESGSAQIFLSAFYFVQWRGDSKDYGSFC